MTMKCAAHSNAHKLPRSRLKHTCHSQLLHATVSSPVMVSVTVLEVDRQDRSAAAAAAACAPAGMAAASFSTPASVGNFPPAVDVCAIRLDWLPSERLRSCTQTSATTRSWLLLALASVCSLVAAPTGPAHIMPRHMMAGQAAGTRRRGNSIALFSV